MTEATRQIRLRYMRAYVLGVLVALIAGISCDAHGLSPAELGAPAVCPESPFPGLWQCAKEWQSLWTGILAFTAAFAALAAAGVGAWAHLSSTARRIESERDQERARQEERKRLMAMEIAAELAIISPHLSRISSRLSQIKSHRPTKKDLVEELTATTLPEPNIIKTHVGGLGIVGDNILVTRIIGLYSFIETFRAEVQNVLDMYNSPEVVGPMIADLRYNSLGKRATLAKSEAAQVRVELLRLAGVEPSALDLEDTGVEDSKVDAEVGERD